MLCWCWTPRIVDAEDTGDIGLNLKHSSSNWRLDDGWKLKRQQMNEWLMNHLLAACLASFLFVVVVGRGAKISLKIIFICPTHHLACQKLFDTSRERKSKEKFAYAAWTFLLSCQSLKVASLVKWRSAPFEVPGWVFYLNLGENWASRRIDEFIYIKNSMYLFEVCFIFCSTEAEIRECRMPSVSSWGWLWKMPLDVYKPLRKLSHFLARLWFSHSHETLATIPILY